MNFTTSNRSVPSIGYSSKGLFTMPHFPHPNPEKHLKQKSNPIIRRWPVGMLKERLRTICSFKPANTTNRFFCSKQSIASARDTRNTILDFFASNKEGEKTYHKPMYKKMRPFNKTRKTEGFSDKIKNNRIMQKLRTVHDLLGTKDANNSKVKRLLLQSRSNSRIHEHDIGIDGALCIVKEHTNKLKSTRLKKNNRKTINPSPTKKNTVHPDIALKMENDVHGFFEDVKDECRLLSSSFSHFYQMEGSNYKLVCKKISNLIDENTNNPSIMKEICMINSMFALDAASLNPQYFFDNLFIPLDSLDRISILQNLKDRSFTLLIQDTLKGLDNLGVTAKNEKLKRLFRASIKRFEILSTNDAITTKDVKSNDFEFQLYSDYITLRESIHNHLVSNWKDEFTKSKRHVKKNVVLIEKIRDTIESTKPFSENIIKFRNKETKRTKINDLPRFTAHHQNIVDKLKTTGLFDNKMALFGEDTRQLNEKLRNFINYINLGCDGYGFKLDDED